MDSNHGSPHNVTREMARDKLHCGCQVPSGCTALIGSIIITGQWCSLAGVEGGLAAPQIFFALGHEERITHVSVMKVLKKQPLVDLPADLPNSPHQELLQMATLSAWPPILSNQAPCVCTHFHTILQDPYDEPEVRQAGSREAWERGLWRCRPRRGPQCEGGLLTQGLIGTFTV